MRISDWSSDVCSSDLMPLPAILARNLRLPVISSPMFLVSNPQLVIAQCKAGIVGSFPALNARPASQLDDWLAEITEALAAYERVNPDRPSAPCEDNQILHKTNTLLDEDVDRKSTRLNTRHSCATQLPSSS